MAIDAALGRLGIKPGVCTSSTRPANPFEGQVIYETDTNNIRFWSGSAWESNKGGIISSSAPTGAAAGDIWYDSDDGRTYIYYDDGSSQQWVEFGAPPVQHGKILQVVSTTKTDTFSSSSTTFTAITGLSQAITPSSATSKILVIANLKGASDQATAQSTFHYRLMRDSTPIGIGDTSGSRTQVTGNIGTRLIGTTVVVMADTAVILDSPATTSSITYSVEGRTRSAGTFYVNRTEDFTDSPFIPVAVSSITVMEVSA